MTINHDELKVFIKDSGILEEGKLSMDDILTTFSLADRSKGADSKAIIAKVVRRRKKKAWVLKWEFLFGTYLNICSLKLGVMPILRMLGSSCLFAGRKVTLS